MPRSCVAMQAVASTSAYPSLSARMAAMAMVDIRKKSGCVMLFLFFACDSYVLRSTTHLGCSSSKRLAASSRIIVGVRSTLASGVRSVDFGVVAARKEVHAQVIDVVQALLAESATVRFPVSPIW